MKRGSLRLIISKVGKYTCKLTTYLISEIPIARVKAKNNTELKQKHRRNINTSLIERVEDCRCLSLELSTEPHLLPMTRSFFTCESQYPRQNK